MTRAQALSVAASRSGSITGMVIPIRTTAILAWLARMSRMALRVPELRLRAPTAALLALPWDLPLSQWAVPDVPLRDIAVGPSRHLVKFVEADGLWAVKEMPPRIAEKEYAVLRRLEEMGLPAVRAAGLVLQPEFDTAILLTRYLEGSWQYRRLFMRLPPDQPKHRARLFDAMANLMVELHRHGVFWGDCSLANTLFSRDGQLLQASLVDAETSEVHPTLSDGQREHDMQILVENVAAGMVDLAAQLGPRGAGRHADRRGHEHSDPIRAAVGNPAQRAGFRARRPIPRRGHHPPPQRARLRRRRGRAAAGRCRSPISCGCTSPSATAATTLSACAS